MSASKILTKRQRTTSQSSIEKLKQSMQRHNELDNQQDEIVTQDRQQIKHQHNSVLFEPYRALGYYTSDIPFCIFKSDQDILLASSVGGHSFYVYNTQKLNCIYMSRFIQQEILWIEAGNDGLIYTALDNNTIVSWKKMNKVQEYLGHSKHIIKFILASELIFSLAQDGEFIIFNTKSGQIVKRKQFNENFEIMMHPTTYINKLIFAGGNKIELWNIIEEELIFQFQKIVENQSDIKCIVQSPVIHTVAVGFQNGEIIMANLQYDQVLFKFSQTEGQLQTLSFSTDTTMGLSLLASTSKSQNGGGNIVLWDLNKQRIYSIIQQAHNGRQVSHLQFMPNEPILISSSDDDNSIKMWFFEKGMTQPRLLKERSGHAETPQKIRFYGGKDDSVNQGARNLISCSKDGYLRDISILNEFQSMNFSDKYLYKSDVSRDEGDQGIGAVKSFEFSEFRERDWQNVLTCHDKAKAPLLWSYANHVISKVQIENAYKQVRVTAVTVSQCGNFGILGYEQGQIQKFNMQSGKDKGVFEQGIHNHKSEITGLGIDQLNKHLVSSSLDCTIKQWDFYRRVHLRTFTHDFPVQNLVYNRMNDLIAFSSSDLTLTLLNSRNGLKKVRTFEQAANNMITDICCSQPDSKWIICSSLDKCIRVWDILTGSLVDWVQFQRAPLSIDFSPSGEFLATSHLGSKAVYLWSNRTFFQNIVIQSVPKRPTQIELPTLSTSETIKESHKDFYKNQPKNQTEMKQVDKSLIELKFQEIQDIEAKMQEDKQDYVKLSNQPYSKWQAIFNLEQIKERNKPILPKRELPKAPFFLFDIDKVLLENDATSDLLREQLYSKNRKPIQEQNQSNALEQHGFNKRLKDYLKSQKIEIDQINQYLKTLSPSGIELEFLSLSTFEFEKSNIIEKLVTPNHYVHIIININPYYRLLQ